MELKENQSHSQEAGSSREFQEKLFLAWKKLRPEAVNATVEQRIST